VSLPTVSLQLYSLRDALEQDPLGTIDRVADMGFRAVEVGARYLAANEGLIAAIHRHGLATPTLTSPLFRHEDRASVWSLAKELGAHTVIDTVIREEHWTTLDAIDAVAADLNAAANEAARHSLRVGYHNHWWELETVIDGTRAFDHLIERLDPAVVLEIDAYWVAVGGEDPAAFIARHADRVRFLHLKDGPVTRDIDRQLPAGTGSMPLSEVIAAAGELETVVVEFDGFDGDVFAAVDESRAFLEELVAGVSA
jgi:sugar phosphate isomerase/epimerase